MMLLIGACEYDRRMLKIDKDWKNAMTSSIVTFRWKTVSKIEAHNYVHSNILSFSEGLGTLFL